MIDIKKYFQTETVIYSTVIALVLAALIIAMLINGIALLNPNHFAGSIFHKKISLNRFKEVHSHLVIQNRMEYGNSFEKLLPLLDLENKTWNRLILLYAAGKKGIKVTDKEVITNIAKYPYFHKKANFDAGLYNLILRDSLKIKPKDFEETVRETILLQKLTEAVTANVAVTDQEVVDEYKKRNEKIAAQYCYFPPENYKEETAPTEKEIADYYKNHLKELRIPASINLEYIRMDFPKNGGVQKEVETKYKAKAIVEEYAKNPNLAQLAQKYKFTVKETGFFGKNNLNLESGVPLKELLDCFKAPQGTLQAPVKNEKGYSVYRVKDKRKAYLPSLKEATDQIIKILKNEKAKAKAKAKAQEYWAKFKTDPSKFAEIIKADNLAQDKIPLLPKEEYFYALSLKKEDESKLLPVNDKNPLSEVIESPKGPCILYAEKFEEINQETFEKEKTAFKEMLLNQKKNEVFSDFMLKQIKKADKEENPSLDFLKL